MILAQFYDNQGKYEQAVSLYQPALQIREQALGPQHPHTQQVRETTPLSYEQWDARRRSKAARREAMRESSGKAERDTWNTQHTIPPLCTKPSSDLLGSRRAVV
jgi:tetratricopeptide (TPR) repeat protein